MEIIAIGQDSPQAFRDYWRDHQLPFIGLPDKNSEIADKYYQKVNLLKLGRMPAEFIIDQEGIIRFVHYGASMSDIPEPEQLLEIVDNLKG